MTITLSTEEARKGFYPTPSDLASELLEDIKWDRIRTILEPSCGKGDLLFAIGKEIAEYKRDISDNLCIDLVEIDPALRGIVNDTYIQKNPEEHYAVYKDYLYKPQDLLTEQAKEKMENAYAMYRACKCKMQFVQEDFLQLFTMTPYDLIVMNPPFFDGDAHLLKAISLQERFGGQIRCILNAETLRNPCTNRRKVLLQKLEEHGAEISYRESAFVDAERTTDVVVAMIRMDIPTPKLESEFFSRFQKAEEQQWQAVHPTEMVSMDPVQQILARYRMEVNAGVKLIQEYMSMKPYIQESVEKSEYDHPILHLKVGTTRYGSDTAPDINDYVKAVRLKYWKGLFANKKIFGKFTSNLRDSLMSRVNQMVDVEFSEYNIRLLITEMNAQAAAGIEETIHGLFHKMTVGHHWRDEVEVKNIHYFNGWCTNKAHFINKKVILPCYDVFSDYSWSKDSLKVYQANEQLADIERTLNFLDGNMSAEVDLWRALERASANGQTKKIQCKFFSVDFFKKGTMHITFLDQRLLDRFNIYCAKGKNWLPPCYGKKKYRDMSAEEQAVVDSFHGDDTPGSGAAQYEKVLAQASYYLAPVTSQAMLGLPQMAG